MSDKAVVTVQSTHSCATLKPATHEPGIRAGHPGRAPGFSDTRAALIRPGHPAWASCSCVADTRRDTEKHCICGREPGSRLVCR